MGTIVITGSASGIGAATRTRVEAAGHQVVGVDLREAEITADLATPDGRQAALAAVLEATGGVIDGLVTSAGLGPPVSAHLIADVNWFGTEVFLTGLREALAASEGIAKVVAVSSNSTTTSPNTPDELIDACLAMDAESVHSQIDAMESFSEGLAYAASKTAVARYVRRHAPTAEWAGAGIRLNAVAPGATLTPLLQGGLDDENFGPMIKSFPVPTGDFGTPDQIAAWIEMMLGDAADFMAGSLVFIDGGTDAMVRADDWPRTFQM